MWMGAHPRAPSEAFVDGAWVPVDELVRLRPREILGDRHVERWGASLPFLFKVLAIERPLSLQAHPDLEQASAGFARENELGIPLGAPDRVFVDANHKPELVCALSRLVALKGFRPIEEIRSLFARVGAEQLLGPPGGTETGSLAALTRRLLSLGEPEAGTLLERACSAAARLSADPCFDWVVRLAEAHSHDAAALAPLFLNFLELAPGEALYLRACELHCYLEGMAVELMANSDNVLRGGLTQKHVDREGLMKVLRFERAEIDIVRPRLRPDGSLVYPSPAAEFSLGRIDLEAGDRWECPQRTGADLLLCTSGRIRIDTASHTERIRPGDSVLVPFCVERYSVAGAGVVYRASVPPE